MTLKDKEKYRLVLYVCSSFVVFWLALQEFQSSYILLGAFF